MADLGDLVARLLLDSAGWTAGMKKVEEETKSGANGVEAALSGIGAGIGAMTGALAAIGLSEKVLEFGQAALAASNEFKKFSSAIVNMRGDSKEVEDFLTRVDEIADKSPFEFPELAQSAQRMVQLGGGLEDVTTTLQSVVDMGTALKLSAEQVNSIMNAMGNLQAGMDPMRTMNQLVKQGVPAWQMLAEQTGKSIGEVKQAVKDGAISNKEILDGLTAGMGKYHEAAEKWSTGFKGSMKGLHEAIEQSMRGVGDSIGNALNTVAAPALRAITTLVEKAGEMWKNLSGPVQAAVIVFGSLVAAIAPIAALWGPISAGLGAVAGALAGPLIPIAALIAAFVAFGLWVSEHWEGIVDVLTHAWDSISEIWGVTWNDILNFLRLLWDSIKVIATTIFNAISGFIGGAFDLVVGIWTGIWNTIKTVVTTVWGGIFNIAKAIFGEMGDFLGGIFQPVIDAWNKVAGIFGPIMKKLGATGAVLSDAFKAITEEMGKAVPAAEKTAKGTKGVGDAMDDTSKAAKEQTDSYKGLSGGAQQLWAMYNQLTGAQKKLAEDIAKQTLANEALAKSGKTVFDVLDAIPEPTLHVSKAVEKLTEDIGKAVALLKDAAPTVERAEAALAALGVTSTRASEAALAQAREQQATVDAAGNMMSAYDKLAASAAVLKKQIEALSKAGGDNRKELDALEAQLADTTAQMERMGMTTSEAFHSMGMKTKQELDTMAGNARAAYEIIAESAGENSNAAKKAWLEYLQILRDQHEQFGTEWTAEDEKQYRRMGRDLDEAHKTQENKWEQFFKDVGKTAQQFKNDVLDLLVFGKGSSAEHNRELDQQAADLTQSLAERTAEWTSYQAGIAKQQADATAEYHAALEDNARDLAQSLAEAAADYDDYARGVQQNIDDIIAKHAEAAAAQVEDAQDALAKQRDAYEEYARDTAEKIDDIHAKYADSLAEEEADLADSLKHRAQSYADFVDDASDKLARVGQDTATNIEDETKDTKKNIADRTKEYWRYAEDVTKKINAVRLKNNGTYSQEEDDLRTSLRRKQEDLDDYITEQNEGLERYVRDQQTRLAREEEDNKESLDRRARDEDEWLADTMTKHDAKVTDLEEGEAREVAAAEAALAKRAAALETFTAETKKKIEEIGAKHAQEQDAEIAKQQASLVQKETDYNASVERIKAKSEEQRTKINTDYENTTAKLAEELAKQTADYEKFKTDIIGPGGKLDQLKEQHRSIWQDIGDMGKAALESIGSAALHLASDQVLGALLGKLGGMKGILGDIGGALSGVLSGGGGLVGEGPIPGGIPGGVPGLGGVGSAAGAAAGMGFQAIAGIVTGAISAVTGVIGVFQSMHQETSLNAIEHNTRYSMMYLGERADGGILGVLFKINEEIAWGANTKATEKLRDLFLDWSGPTLAATMDLLTLAQSSTAAVLDLRAYVYDIGLILTDMRQIARYVSDSVEAIATDLHSGGARSITVNVTAAGLTTADAARVLGNQIAQNLATQMVAIR